MFLLLCVGIAAAGRLDNTYLPPSNARTAGGNGNFLGTPSSQYGAPNGGFDNVAPAPEQQYGAPVASARRPSFPSRNGNGISSSYGAPSRSAGPAPVYGPPSDGHYNGGRAGSSPFARANILRFNNENNGDGSYRFDFETENKISQQEEGQLKNAGPEGEVTVVQGSYSYEGDDGQTYTVNYIADENGFQPSGDHIHREIQMAAADAARNAQSEGGYPDRNQYSSNQYTQATNGQNGYRY